MPMAHAVRLCPHLVIVRPEFKKYRAVSSQVFAIYREVTPLVEPLSLDEAYLDVTENAWGEPLGRTVAARLKARIHQETGLTASAGVAPNKFLAKIASGWKKPDGLTVIAPERVERFLQGLPIDALWGVGPVTASRLREHGIDKLVDVRAIAVDDLRAIVGSLAPWLQQLALGVDDRSVEPNRQAKSASSENTFNRDLTDLDEIRAAVDEMARDVAGWLGRKQQRARTVTVKVRYDDFATITRSVTVLPPTEDADAIAARAVSLLDRTDAGRRPVRLLGVGVHNLSGLDDEPPARPPSRHEPPRLPFDDDSAVNPRQS
jgi:DNA polymerase-4